MLFRGNLQQGIIHETFEKIYATVCTRGGRMNQNEKPINPYEIKFLEIIKTALVLVFLFSVELGLVIILT
jgi:hypothetical protein